MSVMLWLPTGYWQLVSLHYFVKLVICIHGIFCFRPLFGNLRQTLAIIGTDDISIGIIMQKILLMCQQRKANRLQQALLALQCLSQQARALSLQPGAFSFRSTNQQLLVQPGAILYQNVKQQVSVQLTSLNTISFCHLTHVQLSVWSYSNGFICFLSLHS